MNSGQLPRSQGRLCLRSGHRNVSYRLTLAAREQREVAAQATCRGRSDNPPLVQYSLEAISAEGSLEAISAEGIGNQQQKRSRELLHETALHETACKSCTRGFGGKKSHTN